MVNVTWADLDSLGFILHHSNHFCVASRFFCSFCEAVPGLLSVTNALALANVVIVQSVEVGRSAVYSSYNSGPRTRPWGTPALTGESSVYSDSDFTRMCLLCR
jgi:hypothetical protein